MISKERAKDRISWIDTAKGFLMLCVIAGHTLRLGSIPQRMMYSFHIPLFVILSGFTMGDVDCWKTYWLKLKKSFLSLYVPMLIIYFLEVFGYTIRDKLSPSEVIEKLYKKLEEDYTILVCDILNKFNNGQRLSDKQKGCLARYIFANDLENILEEAE